MGKRKRADHNKEPAASASLKKTTQNPQATLLGIPGELRNRIYRYALLEDCYITITASTSTEPGLLRTCRQTRNEACEIYRQENSFRARVVDCRPEVPVIYGEHWITGAKSGWVYTGRSHWQNLKAWMKRVHERSISGELYTAEPSSVRVIRVVQLATKIVVESKDSPWKKVEAILETFKEGVMVGDEHFWTDIS